MQNQHVPLNNVYLAHFFFSKQIVCRNRAASEEIIPCNNPMRFVQRKREVV